MSMITGMLASKISHTLGENGRRKDHMSMVDVIGIINFATACDNVDEKATECASLWVMEKGPGTRDIDTY